MEFTIKNDGPDRRLELADGEHVIGRHQDSSLRLGAKRVSGRHAKLRIDGERLFITELGSTNGTLIDDGALQADKGEVEVHRGSKIQCADVLILRSTGEATTMSETGGETLLTRGSYRLDQGFSPAARDRIAGMLSSLFELIALDDSSESLADKTCQFVSRWLQADRVVLLEDRGEGTTIEPRGFWSRDDVTSDELMLSQTLVQQVFEERTSVLLVDVQGMAREASDSMMAMHLRTAMAVPLFDNQRVRGILYVDSARPGVRFSDDDLQMVTAAANAVAIKLRNQSMVSELATAATIQQAILPDELPEIEGYELLARLDMCRAVGGDLYHALPRPDGQLMLALGDVAGKGMPASLAMSACIVLLSTLAEIGGELDQVMSLMHRKLYENLTVEQFITLFLCDLEPATGRLSYVNAGHELPLIIRADGGIDELQPCSPPVGMLPEFPCRIGQTTLESGDLLAIFSDGIPEATIDGEEFLGLDPVRSLLTERREQPLAEISDAIGDTVARFLKGGHASDDVTLMLLRRR